MFLNSADSVVQCCSKKPLQYFRKPGPKKQNALNTKQFLQQQRCPEKDFEFFFFRPVRT